MVREEVSNSCGALYGFLNEIQKGPVVAGLDMKDVEYSLMKQEMMKYMPKDSKIDNLYDLTKVALLTIEEQLDGILDIIIKDEVADYAVLTSILINGPNDSLWVDPER